MREFGVEPREAGAAFQRLPPWADVIAARELSCSYHVASAQGRFSPPHCRVAVGDSGIGDDGTAPASFVAQLILNAYWPAATIGPRGSSPGYNAGYLHGIVVAQNPSHAFMPECRGSKSLGTIWSRHSGGGTLYGVFVLDKCRSARPCPLTISRVTF